MAQVRANGMVLRHAAADLRADRDVVHAAVVQVRLPSGPDFSQSSPPSHCPLLSPSHCPLLMTRRIPPPSSRPGPWPCGHRMDGRSTLPASGFGVILASCERL